jgi:hypothetical protein
MSFSPTIVCKKLKVQQQFDSRILLFSYLIFYHLHKGDTHLNSYFLEVVNFMVAISLKDSILF